MGQTTDILQIKHIVILFLLVIFSKGCLASSETAQALHDDLFENYTRKIRPRLNYSEAVEVEVQFILNSISSMDEINQVLYTIGFIAAYWRDDFLQWTPSDYNGIEHIVVPASDIWLPDIGFANSAGSFYDESYQTLFQVHIHYTGNIAWIFGGNLATSCELILTYYPFDKQTCSVIIENWAYTQEDVDLVYTYPNITVSDWSPNGIWNYVSSSAEISYFNYDVHVTNNYPRITFSMNLTRKSTYYLNSIMIPCILLLVVALAVFWLPPESGEKIGLGITLALAFSVFQIVINGVTPANSDYTPLISNFVLFIMSFTTLSCLISVAVYYFHHKGSKTSVPQPVKVFLFRYCAKALCMRAIVPDYRINLQEHQDEENKTGIKVANVSDRSLSEKKVPLENGVVEKLASIENHLMMLRQHIKDKEKDDLIIEDWKAIASIIDRLFFWIVLIICIIGVAVFMTRSD